MSASSVSMHLQLNSPLRSSVTMGRETQHSVAAYSDAGCRAAVGSKEPAAKANGNLPKETTKGPRPEPDHLPKEPAFVTFLRGVTFLGPRPEPDLLPEEHSESATRGLWLRGQRRTQVLLVSDVWDTL